MRSVIGWLLKVIGIIYPVLLFTIAIANWISGLGFHADFNVVTLVISFVVFFIGCAVAPDKQIDRQIKEMLKKKEQKPPSENGGDTA